MNMTFESNDNVTPILIEIQAASGMGMGDVLSFASGLNLPVVAIDSSFEPVLMEAPDGNAGSPMGEGLQMTSNDTYLIRATIASEQDRQQLLSRPDVVNVWTDTPIEPFLVEAVTHQGLDAASSDADATQPDCQSRTPKGTIQDVADALELPVLWANNIKGKGVVVGVVDGGITAANRQVKPNQTNRRINNVIGGWPSDWGTQSGWGEHGNMCATDVLGMAPDASIYDLRIAGSTSTISRAIQAFQWAINQFKKDGTPHILSNSWGIFQDEWDRTYARNPNHPFTRKVVEAINRGIIVLFAAGNCGRDCADRRCGDDQGPGRSIWGANGHPLVMTVAAVNLKEERAGYSSQGPAALDPNKPDFCSFTHFTGYFRSDSGTSAATPVAAGAVALLKQANPELTPNIAKAVLRRTAKDLGPANFDRDHGAGLMRPVLAFNFLKRENEKNQVRMIGSGQTLAGATPWKVYWENNQPRGIYLDVDTSSAGFSKTPHYVTSLGGNSGHWVTVGGSSVYRETAKGFRVYVTYVNRVVSPEEANRRGWHVNWIGVETEPVS